MHPLVTPGRVLITYSSSHRYAAAMRILVVEDEPKMAGLLQRGLVEEGYAIDLAATGTEAIWAATENPYDAKLIFKYVF